MLRILLFLGFILQSSTTAFAVIMTFDSIPYAYDYSPAPYTEHGITATGRHGHLFGYDTIPGALQLDDSGGFISNSVSFTTGNNFDPVSLDIIASYNSFFYLLFNPADSSVIHDYPVPYDNVQIQGFREGGLVAEDVFYMGDAGDVTAYAFDTSFSNIDMLMVTALFPDIASIQESLLAEYSGYEIHELTCNVYPCAPFNLDNLEINPVPVPAALPLFLSAMGFFGFLYRRKFNSR